MKKIVRLTHQKHSKTNSPSPQALTALEGFIRKPMKRILIFSIIILSTGFVFSQHREIKDRFSLRLSYGNVNSKQIIPVFTNQTVSLQETIYKKKSQYVFEGLYRLNRLWEVGMYFGYSKGTFISNEILSSEPGNYRFDVDRFGSSCFYGLKSEFQLLPLLLKVENLRLNVYCPFQIGLISQNISTKATGTIKWDSPAFEIGAGTGIGYFFTKNIGIYGEYLFGHFYNNRNSQLKAGVVLNF